MPLRDRNHPSDHKRPKRFWPTKREEAEMEYVSDIETSPCPKCGGELAYYDARAVCYGTGRGHGSCGWTEEQGE